jgi:hypothetical protein
MGNENKGFLPITGYYGYVLGENISKHLAKTHTVEHFWPTFISDTYHFEDDDIEVSCDTEGVIKTIGCSNSFIFYGNELIGMDINEFLDLVDDHLCNETGETVTDSNGNKRFYDVFEYPNLNLQVWSLDDTIQKIKICSSFWWYEENEETD